MSTKIILKKNKELGTVWHPESSVVFKSKDDKIAIGRWNGTILIQLDNETIEACEKWGFKIDESLIEEEVSDEEPLNEVVSVEEHVVDEVVSVEEHPIDEVVSVEEPTEEEHVVDEVVSVEEHPIDEVVSVEEHTMKTNVVENTSLIELSDIRRPDDKPYESIISRIQNMFVEHEITHTDLLKTREQLAIVTSEFEALKIKLSALRSLLG